MRRVDVHPTLVYGEVVSSYLRDSDRSDEGSSRGLWERCTSHCVYMLSEPLSKRSHP